MKKIIIISGISGSGKSSIINSILSNYSNIAFSISLTTRSIRPGESKKNYHFVSEEDFKRMIDQNKMIEYVNIFDNYYGSNIDYTNKLLELNDVVIFDVDTYGFKMIKSYFQNKINYHVVGIWIEVDKDSILNRLKYRGEKNVYKRVEYVKKNYELFDEKNLYDYIVENNILAESVKKIEDIILRN